MPDFLPVRMQDFLYSGKPELREQQPLVVAGIRKTGTFLVPYGRMIVGAILVSLGKYILRYEKCRTVVQNPQDGIFSRAGSEYTYYIGSRRTF